MAETRLRGEVRALPASASLSEHDVYLFREGRHTRLYERLGSHACDDQGQAGTAFAVWAPNAESVSVIGDFNGWDRTSHLLARRRDGSGIWEGFVAGVAPGSRYKYHVASRYRGYRADKGDPFAFAWEAPPQTASRVWSLNYRWGDAEWMASRGARNALDAPLSIYEMHAGSWRRRDGSAFLTYRELAAELPAYLADLGFTHVEFLPLTEHPFYGSWGYQTTGYFAPTARYGTPQDFMFLVDSLHAKGIGVILDWVPSHFPGDEHGLAYFDGTHLYEHADPRQGYHPDWSSYIFNYGRNEVRAMLASSARFWLDRYHVDGLRVDAVASMLYLDYGRRGGEWVPNRYGGRENLDAIEFLRHVNESAYRDFPDTQTIAEESTAWPMVSRPTYLGGLGFGMKWNMGWMHDTLAYMSHDPVHRSYHQNEITFSIWYAFSENFVLPLSHDEVVYGKRSLISKMPGDEWQRFANLRLLFGYMWMHPGKKLLFMGGEFAQWREWNHDQSLDWHLADFPPHRQTRQWLRDLNGVYRGEPALHAADFRAEGFEWIDTGDAAHSVISFLRRGGKGPAIAVVCNFTPVTRHNYRVGVPCGGFWREILNSDAACYGGSGQGNLGGIDAAPLAAAGRDHSLNATLPPLSVVVFRGA
ncbi:MAG TPA: 1,4-alpha-glucan branching protein GlgB [Casimicrobiaceae bacterium]|nr:1,4-alpha-glucan branching protein GlgB [Casimicrobiaceae bacterium]